MCCRIVQPNGPIFIQGKKGAELKKTNPDPHHSIVHILGFILFSQHNETPQKITDSYNFCQDTLLHKDWYATHY